MSATPQISVLMPYRQCETTVEEAADSILAQRGVALELVAIDDGSTDGGPARMAALAARHRQIVTLSTGGAGGAGGAGGVGGVGIVGALRAGLAVARGALIARMDGDDVCAPERLVQQRMLLEAEPGLAVVGTQVRGFPDAHVGPGMAHYIAWQNQLVSASDHAREIFIEAPLCHPSVLIRRAALERVGAWRESGGPEDYDLWLRLDAAGWGLAKVPAVLFSWRHGPGRSTFTDPRYARERFLEAKAPHLARRLRGLGRPLAIWGAGPTGKRLARALEPWGVRAQRFIDIDPRKIGRAARHAPIVAPDALARGRETVVVAVGARHARAEIRARLAAGGWVETVDYLCAA
jgi:GT2 family glycosyltransferase